MFQEKVKSYGECSDPGILALGLQYIPRALYLASKLCGCLEMNDVAVALDFII
jgi:hypothetical protein